MLPEYQVIDENNKPYQIGEIPLNFVGSTSKTSPPRKPDPTAHNYPQDASLFGKDIYGTNTGTKYDGNFHTRRRTQINETNKTNDIHGSNADSLFAYRKKFEGKYENGSGSNLGFNS